MLYSFSYVMHYCLFENGMLKGGGGLRVERKWFPLFRFIFPESNVIPKNLNPETVK